MRALPRALDAVGDGLWGAEDERTHPAPHALPVFLGVAVAVVVLLVLRRTDAITNPQFWAEDGSVFVLSSALALIGRPQLATMATNARALGKTVSSIPARYHFLAVGLVYLAALASVDRLPRARYRSIAIGVLLTWLVCSEAPTFVLRPFYDLDWPSYAARLERKWAEGSPDPVSIPINPDRSGFWFSVKVDERTIRPEVNVPLDAIVGSLPDTTAEQSFVARCPDLSEIDLLFGKEGHAAAQTVHVQLREERSGRVVATFARDAAHIVGAVGPEAEASVATIERQVQATGATVTKQLARRFAGVDNPVPLYFAPIPDSEGRRYVISVTASGGGPGDSVNLFGSAADAYPEGQANLNGNPIPGDLAFQYACSRR